MRVGGNGHHRHRRVFVHVVAECTLHALEQLRLRHRAVHAVTKLGPELHCLRREHEVRVCREQRPVDRVERGNWYTRCPRRRLLL